METQPIGKRKGGGVSRLCWKKEMEKGIKMFGLKLVDGNGSI